MQIPDSYTLEHLSDEEFWDLAFAKAFPSSVSSVSSPLFASHVGGSLSSLSSPSASHTMPSSSTEHEERQNMPQKDEIYVLCDNAYAFPLTALHEIISVPQHMTLLPATPPWMMGLVAWRGSILAAIDLHIYLVGTHNHTATSSSATSSRSLLITHSNNQILAFAVTLGHTIETNAHMPFPHDRYTLLDVEALLHTVIQHLERKTTDE